MVSIDQTMCSFHCDALPLDNLLVSSWQGQDVISRPYRFEAVLASTNPLIDEDALLGQSACLTFCDAAGTLHNYHGMVTQVQKLDADDRYSYCQVVLEPRLTRLRLQRFSEVWLDKDLTGVVRDVLKEAGLSAEGPGIGGDASATYDFDLRVSAEDIARTQANFTCQYEETSFDFFSRLLEYHGWYYYFVQQADHEALVICNDLSFQPKTFEPVLYRPLDNALEVEKSAVARSFTSTVQVQSANVVLQDFSASNAQLELRASASIATASLPPGAADTPTSPAFTGHYGMYGEHFGTNAEGDRLAQLRAQASGCRHRLYTGQGRALGLRAGYQMQLLGHRRPAFNGNYLVLESYQSGRQSLPGNDDEGVHHEFQTRFVTIDTQLQYRSPLTTPKPNIRGVITAIVDGDKDGQALLNEHGCYKVKFPFVRSDKQATRGSAWLRMASLSTGVSHGMHFPLLKGTEVMVSFLGGDPDRPIIIGTLPNSENVNKVTSDNASQSGISSPGGHYLAMEDNEAGALMRMGAPGGNTSFTMGNGTVQGAHLRTDASLHLSSTELNHSVGDTYSFKVLGAGTPPPANPSLGDTPPADTPPDDEQKEIDDLKKEVSPLTDSEGKVTAKWGPFKSDRLNSDLNLGAKVAWNNSKTVSVGLNTAVEKMDASIGLLKQELNVQGATLSFAIAGPKKEYALSLQNQTFKEGDSIVKAWGSGKTLQAKEESITKMQEAVFASHKSGVNVIEGTQVVELKVGSNVISVNRMGITITSDKILNIEGDVRINGNLSIEKSVAVQGSVCAVDVVANGLIQGGSGFFEGDIQSETLIPIVPVMPSTAMVEMIPVSAELRVLGVVAQATAVPSVAAAEAAFEALQVESEAIRKAALASTFIFFPVP